MADQELPHQLIATILSLKIAAQEIAVGLAELEKQIKELEDQSWQALGCDSKGIKHSHLTP